jgi:biotin carboxylase
MKISPDFCIVKSLEDLHAFASSHSFPLILKPANLAKSLLVTKCHNIEELISNYGAALEIIEKVYEKYAPNNERILVLEEFMEGSIHSVDAFIDSEGNTSVLDSIVDYETGYDIGYNDNFHYSRIVPSRLSSTDQKALKNVAIEGAKALGMKSSAAHIEIIMTRDGPKIVEIGARNGGYRQRMHQLSDGVDLYRNLLAVTTNSGKINIVPAKHEYCAVLELFPRKTGIFAGIKSLKELESLPSLNYLKVKYSPGDTAGLSSEGYKAGLIIALHSSDENTFQKDLEFIKSKVSILVK